MTNISQGETQNKANNNPWEKWTVKEKTHLWV